MHTIWKWRCIRQQSIGCFSLPNSGWLLANVADLSILAQSASIPPDVIEEAANQLVAGVSEAAGLLQDMAKDHSGAIHKISEELCQEDGEQTRRGDNYIGECFHPSRELGGRRRSIGECEIAG
jgi:hypothetical protein